MPVNFEPFSTQDETHILHPASRQLFRFWESMRAEKAAPLRSELDLAQIRALVPSLFIGEFSNRSRVFRWRLAGTAICELYRRELTGTAMLADWDGFETETISRFLGATITGRQPCVLRFRIETDRQQVIGAELAGFPLTAADGRSTHIFGGLFPFRDIAPLDYGCLLRFELAAARSIWTENLTVSGPAERPETLALRNFRVIAGGRSNN